MHLYWHCRYMSYMYKYIVYRKEFRKSVIIIIWSLYFEDIIYT